MLAGKKTVGKIDGSILFNGEAPGETFPRAAGYVEQTNSHEESMTVKEAVEFSANLRYVQ